MLDNGALLLQPLRGIPRVEEGADIAQLILGAMRASGLQLQNKDIIVIAQKIVSKA